MDCRFASLINGALDGAKRRLVSSLAKRNLVEHVVPSVIELKRMLEAARSPLLGDLMAATRFLLKDYKTELEDILIADKQLARELLYDLRREDEVACEDLAANKETEVTTRSVPIVHRDDEAPEAGKKNIQTRKTPPSKLAAMTTPCRTGADKDSRHAEFAGVDAAATPAAAAALASAAGDGDSGGHRQKTPFASSFRPTVDALGAHEIEPLSVPKIRSGNTPGPSRTSSITAALARTASISLKNPDDLEPELELRQWNLNHLPEPDTVATTKIDTQGLEPEEDAVMPRRGRGQKRKA